MECYSRAMKSNEFSRVPVDKHRAGDELKSDVQRNLEALGFYKGYIYLVTPEEFESILDGTELVSITGERVIKGKDRIDGSVQAGYLAFGLPTMIHVGTRHRFREWKI